MSNPLFGLAPAAQQYAAIQGVSAQEKSIVAGLLDALASIPEDVLIPAYNQDDIYIYQESNLEIVEVVPCSSHRSRLIAAGIERVPAGYGACKGFGASRLGLWHKPVKHEKYGRVICDDRARQLRLAYRASCGGV